MFIFLNNYNILKVNIKWWNRRSCAI